MFCEAMSRSSAPAAFEDLLAVADALAAERKTGRLFDVVLRQLDWVFVDHAQNS